MFYKLTAFVLAGVFISMLCAVVKSDCRFDVVNNDTAANQPVLIYNTSSGYKLAVPEEGYINLKRGENISLLCSDDRNYVRQTNANVSTVSCIEGNRVKLFRNEYNFEDIKCKRNVRGEVGPTDLECSSNGGKIYLIGYPVSRTDWVTLITICFKNDSAQTLYTRHTIPGKEINYRVKQNKRLNFPFLARNSIEAILFYRKDLQNSLFSKVLNSSTLAEKYINASSFLAKGHLSPDADFILSSAQYSTYHYINVAPQWQNINSGNWKSVENTVRKLAVNYGELEIVTGTHGKLQYNNAHGKPTNIYFGSTKVLPVPKYFWKVVYDPRSKRAIAFVVFNDQHMKLTNPIKGVFCKDICEKTGYTNRNWKIPSSGYVFCCSVQDFRKKVKEMPNLDVSEVLIAPN